TKVIEGLSVDNTQLLANLKDSASLAEPAYILLAESGETDAHEIIRKITLAAEKENKSFADALAKEPEILAKISAKLMELKIIDAPEKAIAFFENPKNYCGLASQKTKELVKKYRALI
ncbi:MAG: adenylosuccinate lyase, partial [Treponema sp.]|nr:adenylosuccinate lyase [Treponema sp.]